MSYTRAIHHGINGTYDIGLCTKDSEHTTSFFNRLKPKHISEVFDIGNKTTITNGDLIKVTHSFGTETRVKTFKYVETGSRLTLKQKIVYVGEE